MFFTAENILIVSWGQRQTSLACPAGELRVRCRPSCLCPLTPPPHSSVWFLPLPLPPRPPQRSVWNHPRHSAPGAPTSLCSPDLSVSAAGVSPASLGGGGPALPPCSRIWWASLHRRPVRPHGPRPSFGPETPTPRGSHCTDGLAAHPLLKAEDGAPGPPASLQEEWRLGLWFVSHATHLTLPLCGSDRL